MPSDSIVPSGRCHVDRECEHCGRPITVWGAVARRGEGRFCSKQCAGFYRFAALKYTPDRFWSKIDKAGDCWIWTGKASGGGYGRLNYQGKRYPAHRLAYILTYGPIPDDLFVCHNCDVKYPPGDTAYRRCCRPGHLFVGDHLANVRDMVQKGRQATGDRNSHALYPERTPRGERHGCAILTAQTVREIRARFAAGDVSQYRLAKLYGVSTTHMHEIIREKVWQHLPPDGQLLT